MKIVEKKSIATLALTFFSLISCEKESPEITSTSTQFNREVKFKQLDINYDNAISKEEVSRSDFTFLKENFDSFDMNQDGIISFDEIKNFKKPNLIFKFLDSNLDGMISIEEAAKARKAGLKENFAKIDADKNGYIEPIELDAKLLPIMIFKNLDCNDDNQISKEEAGRAKKDGLAENFHVIDTNYDGYIQMTELKLFINNYRLNKNS